MKGGSPGAFFERETTGPLEDSYFPNRLTREIEQFPSLFHAQHEEKLCWWAGFWTGIIHGGVLLPDGSLHPEATALVTLYDQDITQGYYAGRQYFFVEVETDDQRTMTDTNLLDRLRELTAEYCTYEHPQAVLRFSIGGLLGSLSGPFFPWTAQEQARLEQESLRLLGYIEPLPCPSSDHFATSIIHSHDQARYKTRLVARTAMKHSGKHVRAKADHLARQKKRLQQKGTRSATRRLVALSGRERRLKADANHCITKQIVARHPHALIGLEHLTDIHERTRRKHGKKATKKQRRANRHHSQWSFAELHRMLAYKAALDGSLTVKVDAHYTSQACPRCGYTSKANRPNKGLLFICQRCHYTLHADLIGARNLALRMLLIQQDWMSTGTLSVCPDGSDDETKAARLRRYAELRWSSDPSSRHSGEG